MTDDHFLEDRRLATVLFAEVTDLHQLYAQLGFDEASKLIKELWMRLDLVVNDFGGHISRHYGDHAMVVWGAPIEREDDPEQAVTAALDMQKAFKTFVAQPELAKLEPLTMQVSIHTGIVQSFYVGLDNHFTVMGPGVKVAQKLLRRTEPNTILITEATYRLVRGAFRVHRLDSVLIRSQTATMHGFVVSEKFSQPSRVRYRSSGGVETHMVARENQLNRLGGLYEAAQSSQEPILGLVVGRAGLGKSRLLMEFTTRLEAEEKNLGLISGRGLEQTEYVPFYLWKSLWFNRFGLSSDLVPEMARKQFMQGIIELWGKKLSDISVIEVAHMIGSLCDLAWLGSPFTDKYKYNQEAGIQRAFVLTRRLFQRMAASESLVLVCDDLQWADMRSLDLLRYILEPSDEPLPLLILGGARPGLLKKQMRWTENAKIIPLQKLPVDFNLVKAAYPDVYDFPDELLLEIAQRADGNPYFMEEIIKSLVMARAGQNGPIDSTLRENLRAHVPNSLGRMLCARLDALSAHARSVALLASVVGRVFWVGALVETARSDAEENALDLPSTGLERTIQQALKELVDAELAFRRAGSLFAGEEEYIFKHAVLREVAYHLLPKKQLRTYHIAVAKWLIRRVGPDFQVMVATQFDNAGAVEEAVHHYQQASQYAESRGALKESQWFLKRVDALGGSLTQNF